jgi:hypothetical protein
MTEKPRKEIEQLSEKAISLFMSYQAVCTKIETLLKKEKEEPHLEVLYQTSDGLVVCVDRNGYEFDNIPIADYLEELSND